MRVEPRFCTPLAAMQGAFFFLFGVKTVQMLLDLADEGELCSNI
jgi:hypothetical protein